MNNESDDNPKQLIFTEPNSEKLFDGLKIQHINDNAAINNFKTSEFKINNQDRIIELNVFMKKKKKAEKVTKFTIVHRDEPGDEAERKLFIEQITAIVQEPVNMCRENIGEKYIIDSLKKSEFIMVVTKGDDKKIISFATLNHHTWNNVKGMHLQTVCSQQGSRAGMVNRIVEYVSRQVELKFLSLEATITAMSAYIRMKFLGSKRFVIGRGCDILTKELKELFLDVEKQEGLWTIISKSPKLLHQHDAAVRKPIRALLQRIQGLYMRSRDEKKENTNGRAPTYDEDNDGIHMTMCFMKENRPRALQVIPETGSRRRSRRR